MQGRMNEAIDAFRRAVELSPKDAAAHAGLGQALAYQGQLTEAIAQFNEALQLNPAHATAAKALAQATRRLAADPKGPASRFLALGDSYTIGESVDATERWPVQLTAMLRKDGINLTEPQIIARTGWTTDELSRAIDAQDPKGPYQLVSLLIGVDDQFRGRAIDQFREPLNALLKRAIGLAGDQSSRVIVLSIPDWGVTPFAKGRDREKIGREIDQFNAIIAEQCRFNHVAFIDITPISRHAADDPSLVAGDGLHPSGTMYHEWAETILPAAKAALSR
jgi:lysophospholipase L1-like esterase